MNQMFLTNCEMILFRILVRLQEENKIDIRNLINNDLINKLKGLQPIDEELNQNVNIFLSLPHRLQINTIVGLDMRIREYCENKGIQYQKPNTHK